ncbi:hypothetical protein PRIPAC_75937 [Pristionchus pacificus]|uniref:Ion channel n=1 Tax=Pristionchus pacificus TaxID=54126 RepID=A0A2A6C5A6_PRIPA|nr:hypothetical protein PRIPAC_75937 [Pristionchus pacificus]|eukprot:PDM73354.1 ion channel [Pristionchus pacificus]
MLLFYILSQLGYCQALLPGLVDTLGGVVGGVGDTLGGVGGGVGGMVGGVGDTLGSAGGGLGGVVGGVVGGVGNLTGAVGGVVGGVADGLGNLTGAVEGVVGGVVDGVGGVVGGVDKSSHYLDKLCFIKLINFQVGGVVGGLLGTTTTSTSSSPTTTTSAGRCAPFTADGVTYANRCVTKDIAATCTLDATKPWCTCTAGWTDTYCSVDTKSLSNLGGNSSGVIDVINEGKNSPARLIASLPALLSFLTDEQRVQMSYTVEEMILEATYEEKPLNIHESFTLFNDPSLGNCFTYNHFNATQRYLARGPGERYGLRVTLDFQINEYVPWVEAVGMYTFVHPIGQNIYLESVKHSLPPGIVDQVAMKKYSFKRMRNMFTSCAASTAAAQSFYFPGDYSVDGCLRSCYQDSVYRSCGCMDPSYSRRDGVKSCNFEKLACIDAMTAERGDPYYWPECTCQLPCRDDEYIYETSRAILTQFSRVLGLTGGFAGVLLGASVVFCFEVFLLIVKTAMIGCGNLKMVNALKMKKHERNHRAT